MRSPRRCGRRRPRDRPRHDAGGHSCWISASVRLVSWLITRSRTARRSGALTHGACQGIEPLVAVLRHRISKFAIGLRLSHRKRQAECKSTVRRGFVRYCLCGPLDRLLSGSSAHLFTPSRYGHPSWLVPVARLPTAGNVELTMRMNVSEVC